NEFRALRDREIHHSIDFLRRSAVPGERDSAKSRRPWLFRQRCVLGEFVPREQANHRRPGVEESYRLSGGTESPLESQRLIKGDAGADIADAERDGGKARNRWRWALTHDFSTRFLSSSCPALCRASTSFVPQERKTRMVGTSPAMTRNDVRSRLQNK